MKNCIFCLLAVLLPSLCFAQTNWYVNQASGSNSNNGLSPSTPFKTVEHAVKPSNGFVQPGDNLLLMGTFTNTSYDPGYIFPGSETPDDATDDDIIDPHIWHAENTIKINNLNGAVGQYITIKPYSSSTVLKGDGANIFRITNCSYLKIQDFEIVGEASSISLDEAFALQFLYQDPATVDPLNPQDGEVLYRVPPGTSDEDVENMTFPVLGSVKRPSYTDTRGLYLSNVHHVEITGNNIFDLPGGGLRVSECEYILIESNEVSYNSTRSYSGTHGLVVTKARSVLSDASDPDDDDFYRVKILRNRVHHNYNRVYSWAPTKSIITPHLDEGKGISLQRNRESNWTNGRFLVANNLAYWNGFSGVHTNEGERMDFINNTCYFNSYTNTITNADNNPSGGNIGISAGDSDDIIIRNNISYIDGDLEKFALSADPQTTNLEVEDNLIYSSTGSLIEDPEITSVQINTVIADPEFTNAGANNFTPQVTSPAIGMAGSMAPTEDYYENARDALPDAGAIEVQGILPIVLTEFTVAATPDDQVHLNWQTAREIDNEYFTIEHSPDGRNWQEIARMMGAGSSNQMATYEYYHQSPLAGTNFYRLQQTDYSGESAYVGVRSLVLTEADEMLTIYPNPAHGTVEVISTEEDNESLKIYSLTGENVTARARIERLAAGRRRVDVTSLPPGSYYLHLGELRKVLQVVR